MTLPRLALLLALLAGCNQPLGSGPEAPPTNDDDSTVPSDDDDAAAIPIGVNCLAPDSVFTFEYQSPGTVQLAAEIVWNDGSVSTPDAVTWALQDGFGGNVNADGLLTMPWNHGGQVVVEAWVDSLVGTCTLDLHMDIAVDATGDPAALSSVDWSATTLDASCAPTVLYPSDGSALPRNWAPIHTQWSPVAGANVYVVQLDNAYVSGLWATGMSSLVPTIEAWRGLTDLWSGSQLSLRVYAGTWDGAAWTSPLCAAPDPIVLDVAQTGLEGQIFYWAAAAAGVFRLTLGAPAPTQWADEATTGYCVGCHTSNLDNPRRMAKVYGGGDGWVVVSDVEEGIGDVMPAQVQPGNFTALDPTGRWMVRSYRGALYLDDLDAGINVGTLPTLGHATHPNWSPDGLSLVYSSCAGASTNDWTQEDCALRTLDRVDVDQWGGDALLVPGGSGTSNYYASYSPDSAWIAFNRAYNEDTYDAGSAELWLVAADGGTPVELAEANLMAGMANSWPRWGEMHDDFAWLAFASRRAYGSVTSGVPQVYLVGLDTDLLGTGVDPSRPALWLPGQDPSIGNHTPVWVPRFVAPE